MLVMQGGFVTICRCRDLTGDLICLKRGTIGDEGPEPDCGFPQKDALQKCVSDAFDAR